MEILLHKTSWKKSEMITAKKTLLFLFFSLLILFPFLTESNIIIKNDLNGNIVPLLYFKESVLQYGNFPLWNPYINQGIPTVADPLYGIYHPFISLPFLFFDPQIAIKITYIFSVFSACMGMYFLSRLLKINDKISVLISLTYASCSYLPSRINAGHLEKIVSFGLLPIFLYFTIQTFNKKNVFWAGLTSITLSFILFSGDIYNAMYSLYILIVFFFFSIFKDRKASLYFVLSFLLFFLFSSVKIFPMVELQQYIFKVKEPFAGSNNLFSVLYYMFFPVEFLVKKIAPINILLPNDFGWWESIAFIGPFSLLGLIFIFVNFKKNLNITILTMLSILFFLLSMPGAWFNPIRYIINSIPLLQYFHVPSRIFLYWVIIILLGLGLYLTDLKKRKLTTIILCINLLCVFIYSQYILLTQTFPKINSEYSKLIKLVSRNNPSSYSLVHEVSQGDIPQDVAFKEKVLLLQSNYGLFLKNSPSANYNFKGNNIYTDIQPGYIISTKKINELNYINGSKTIHLYDNTSNSIPFASVNNQPQKFTLLPNKIVIARNNAKDGILTVLQSNYPGWSIYINGKKGHLLKSRFLQAETLRGATTYELRYFSESFIIGLIISLFSFFLWFTYIVTEKKK